MSPLRKATIPVALAALVLVTTPSTQAVASPDESSVCRSVVTAQTEGAVPESLVSDLCDTWVTNAPESAGAAPQFTNFAVSVGAESADGFDVAVDNTAGWPMSATCLVSGAITSASTAYYVLVGAANTLGPATSSRIRCTASPSGLVADQQLPGAAAVASDFTTTLLPGDPLTTQDVCSYGEFYYLIRPLYQKTSRTPCSLIKL